MHKLDMNCLFFDDAQWTLYYDVRGQRDMGWKYAASNLANKTILAKIAILRIVATKQHVFETKIGIFDLREASVEKAMLLKWLKN